MIERPGSVEVPQMPADEGGSRGSSRLGRFFGRGRDTPPAESESELSGPEKVLELSSDKKRDLIEAAFQNYNIPKGATGTHEELLVWLRGGASEYGENFFDNLFHYTWIIVHHSDSTLHSLLKEHIIQIEGRQKEHIVHQLAELLMKSEHFVTAIGGGSVVSRIDGDVLERFVTIIPTEVERLVEKKSEELRLITKKVREAASASGGDQKAAIESELKSLVSSFLKKYSVDTSSPSDADINLVKFLTQQGLLPVAPDSATPGTIPTMESGPPSKPTSALDRLRAVAAGSETAKEDSLAAHSASPAGVSSPEPAAVQGGGLDALRAMAGDKVPEKAAARQVSRTRKGREGRSQRPQVELQAAEAGLAPRDLFERRLREGYSVEQRAFYDKEGVRFKRPNLEYLLQESMAANGFGEPVFDFVRNHLLQPEFGTIASVNQRLREGSLSAEDKKILLELRNQAYNELYRTMVTVLTNPAELGFERPIEGIEPTSSASLTLEDLEVRLQADEDFPFHINGELIYFGKLRELLGGVIETAEGDIDEATLKHLKYDYISPLMNRYMRACDRLKPQDPERYQKQANRLRDVAQVIKQFLESYQAPGGSELFKSATISHDISGLPPELQLVFGRIEARPNRHLSHDDREGRRAGADAWAERFSREEMEEIANAIKYPDQYPAESLTQDAYGSRPLMMVSAMGRRLASNAFVEADVPEGEIERRVQQFMHDEFHPIMKEIHTAVMEMNSGNGDVVTVRELIQSLYSQLSGPMNSALVSTRRYLRTHPLREELGEDLDDEEVLSVELPEDYQEYLFVEIDDTNNRDERMIALKLHQLAIDRQLQELVGDNAWPEVCDSVEYLALQKHIQSAQDIVAAHHDLSDAYLQALEEALDKSAEARRVLLTYIETTYGVNDGVE